VAANVIARMVRTCAEIGCGEHQAPAGNRELPTMGGVAMAAASSILRPRNPADKGLPPRE